MSYSNQATAYRERDVLTASPARLVVLLYEHALSNLLRARRAVQTGNLEDRVTAVGKARDAIMELLVTLNVEQGGEIAKNLQSLYTFVITELSDVARRPDGARLEVVIRIVSDLHGAFAAIAKDSAQVPAAYMSSTRTSAIALHVEAAKRLLRELEQHAELALHALGHEGGDEFVAAVDERARIIAQLDDVVEALSQERVAGDGAAGGQDPEISSLFAEMAQAAAAALESHDQLASQTRRERDRLAAAIHRTNRPDTVAHQYAAAAQPARSRTLSVTG